LSHNGPFPSNQPQVYYKLLLLGKKIDADLGAKSYNALLDREGTDSEASDEPLAVEDIPSARLALEDDVTFSGGAASRVLPALPPPAAVAPRAKAPLALPPPLVAPGPQPFRLGAPTDLCQHAPKPSSSSSSSSSGSDDGLGGSSESEVEISGGEVWKSVLGMPKIKLDRYEPKGKTAYDRFIVKCRFHKCCYKKRSLAKTEVFGRVEPCALLQVWASLGEREGVTNAKSHLAKVKPSRVEISDWVREHGSAYEAAFF
jgi:hypothetical protein